MHLRKNIKKLKKKKEKLIDCLMNINMIFKIETLKC